MSFSVINNFFHLLATVSWIGGMIFINSILIPSQTALDPSQRGKLFGTVTKKFTILVWISVIILLVTGLYKTPSSLLLSTSSRFGLWLTVKHISILIMIINGLALTFRLSPKLRALAPELGEKPSDLFLKTQQRLKILSLSNMVLGIIVLFCVSMMQYY